MGILISAVISIVLMQVVSCQPADNRPMLVASAVVQSDDPNTCPPMDVLETARQGLSSAVREILSELPGVPMPVPQCGTGLWTRLIALDMSDPTQQCPSAWMEYNVQATRFCARPPSVPDVKGCNEISLAVSTPYRRVCGRAYGRTTGSPDAFRVFDPSGPEDDYVDGVRISHSPARTHIWTFAADSGTGSYHCPCNAVGFNPTNTPTFQGENYFCDSVENGRLWDGEGCVSSIPCCPFNSPPWFSVQLPADTSDNVDVRICLDQPLSDENVGVELLEILVQ